MLQRASQFLHYCLNLMKIKTNNIDDINFSSIEYSFWKCFDES